GEDHVGAGLDVGDRAFDRAVDALHRGGVGARHDDEGVVAAGVHGGLDAVDHLVLRHHFLAGTVAATLLPDLVLHVHRGDADALEIADRAGDVERPAPAGVDVHRQRHPGRIHDPARVGEHVL